MLRASKSSGYSERCLNGHSFFLSELTTSTGVVPNANRRAASRRTAGQSLNAIRDALRARGFAICKQSVANILARQEAGAAA